MHESPMTRLAAAAREVLTDLEPIPPQDTAGPYAGVLEDLECALGVMSMKRGSVASLDWTLTTSSGAQARGWYRLDLDDSGPHLSEHSRPMGLTSLDWGEHLQDMRPRIAQAMRTLPGWSALRARLVTEALVSRRSDLRKALHTLLVEVEDTTIAECWAAVSLEQDPRVAVVAEGVLTNGTFTGTAQDLMSAARGATRD